jgi:hypothetical protein
LAETVTVAGKKLPKNEVYIGVVLVAGVVVVAVYRSRKASQQAAAATTGTDPLIDPATGIPYAQEQGAGGIDPVTGIPYSQEQGGSYGAYGTQAGYGYGYGAAGAPGVPLGYGGAAGSTTPIFSDNASWAQYVESYLAGLGGDPNTIGNALGKYITGQGVTPAQQALIEQAIAFGNKPPVAGSGGFPPSINLLAVTNPPPPPPPPGGGGSLPAPTGLHVTSVWSTGADIHWNPVPGATGYSVAVAGQSAVDVGNTTYHGIGGLKPKTHYTVNVAGKPSSSGHASVSFTTK